MTDAESIKSIQSYKEQLGKKLLILGHYYQSDELFKLADMTGDSYQLAVAASESTAEYIVMCGVLFMAESCRLLIREKQRAFTPEKLAGCPMADMIDAQTYRIAYEKIVKATGKKPIPLLYVNSTVETKAAVGGDNGLCCTSSNALPILKKLIDAGNIVFFLPDKNLAENSSAVLGIGADEFSLVGRDTKVEEISGNAKVYAWKGFCIVHERISMYDVLLARKKYPDAKIIVHPECGREIVNDVDYAGSTKQLLDYFYKVPPNSSLVVGTEHQFVDRLRRLRNDVEAHHLADAVCVNMAKVTVPKLERCLSALARQDKKDMARYEVLLPEEYYEPAKATLTKMISYAG
ncbi:MAG TPA: quinolinate synthase [Lentisphaeria bacterium]|nr:MAG: hypothetical protein A2X47_04980 [Lentisphaerae bacterium GWF2_38_69]HBM14834.1 quinolinate synthase [Lentisphaeria bacterium]